MAITSIRINQQVGKLFEKSISGKNFVSRFLNKEFDKAINEPAKFASAMLLTSIVSKDAVGCVVYTSQSLNNKKIPEDKRGFVAALDLINGILMVGGQLAIGKIIEGQLTPKLFGKLYSGTIKDKDTKIEKDLPGIDAAKKSRLTRDNMLERVKTYITKNKITDVNAEEVAKALNKNIGKGSARYKLFEAGFGLIVTALVTTALVKRTLVPLISTPLSGWFKGKFMDKPKEKEIVPNRMAYEWSSLATKNTPKIDKTAFSNFSSNK